MSQNGKLMPNLDHQSTKVHNLTVLQRIDAFVEEILITAGHVTSYDFNIELNQWSRKDVEGSLFVVKRSTQPRFQFIILNRRKTDNLVENILGDFEYEVQVPYLLYRNAAQEVNGIWFYSSQDCEAVANLFSRILNAFSRVPPQPKVSSTKSSEFEELESLSTSDAIEGSLEPLTSSAASAPDVPDDSFVNFFSAATNIGNGPNAAFAGQPHQLNLSSNITGQACQSSADNLLSKLSFNAPSVVAAPNLQPAPSLPSAPLMPLLDTHESSIGGHHSTNLIKPSSFAPAPTSSALMMPPISSSIPTAPPLHPPVTMQQPYGTPLLQPFPPPTPPPSLTPATTSNYEAVITREKVQDALLRLVQNNQFIDMVYREMLNAHYQ